MKIVDLRCAVIDKHPIVRIVTDEGISGYGQIEFWKPYLKPHVLSLRDRLLGLDPTNVENVMRRIRFRGAFKPWGSAISAIEMALWDVAGKAAGLPVHKLLGGKVRDRVRVYNGGRRFPFAGQEPEDYAEDLRRMMALPEGFTIIKQPISFHSPMARKVEDYHYGEVSQQAFPGLRDTGLMTERGFKHTLACVEAMKEVAGDRIGLALDCGPGWTLPDAQRFAKAVEPLNLLWLEDMLTGDQIPFVNAEVYRDLTTSTTTPIHTGEQIYLRQNFKELIERRAVDVLGPDPCDVGGIAELKWVAEYADLHGILFAPHGTANGLLGLAALLQVSATLPDNFIAFECPIADPDWWGDIVTGLPSPIVRDGFIEVWDSPGMGVDFVVQEARRYLREEDAAFFD
ncbi:MAG TPA: mandelate racemase/muconate lactonizing enzyme family protein [Geminicoccus sp.]|jgi:L-alanine-DL-glutamate epimerase-like enolase superfamily enzyme|uniref:mandelate racemase/muconate lactonizing enzyme family protein n=1 Tax=Geminicoccus sp. TaxID=2024832 RepID=UPI002E34C539|nr:mandelate racemase/muconate lactonizing enzyme family protein [Geminicoccus sp.]HEX2527362.1 mandelate racemase/muconate lactonizing enzyme family protein [Geminicoccus sp.]